MKLSFDVVFQFLKTHQHSLLSVLTATKLISVLSLFLFQSISLSYQRSFQFLTFCDFKFLKFLAVIFFAVESNSVN